VRILRDVFESTISRPGRTLLALLAIAIGMLSLTVLISTLYGLTERAEMIAAEMGADVFAIVADSGSQGIQQDHLARLRANLPDHVFSSVKPYTVREPGGGESTRVLAGDPQLLSVRPWGLLQGRMLDLADLDHRQAFCLVTEAYSRKHDVHLHDFIQIHPAWLQVVGIVKATGSALQELRPDLAGTGPMVIIPHTLAPVWSSARYAEADKVELGYVRHPAGLSAEASMKVVERLLVPEQATIGPVRVVTADLLISGIAQLQRLITLTTGSIAGLCLLLGGTTLMSLMIANVRERVNEVGLRMALGASRGDIYALFMLEALWVTLVAALAGSFGAYGLLVLLREQLTFPTYIGAEIFWVPLGVSLGVGLFFSWLPARQAARIVPAEALRND
jgi:putative ABC transport system permease protein